MSLFPLSSFKNTDYPVDVRRNVFERNKSLRHIIVHDSYPKIDIDVSNEQWKMNRMIFIVSFIDICGNVMENNNKIWVYGEDLEHYVHKVMHNKKSFIYNYMNDDLFLSQSSNYSIRLS